MKVPTYTAQLQRPRQGQGQFLTAQLSASAMAAPGRAYAESGQQLARAGSDLAAFGMKKAQVGADNEAQAAAAKLDIELQQMQLDFLANPNMQQAEQKYQDMARRKVETYKSGMSNRLARDAFRSRAAQISIRNQSSFLKANNERVVQQRTVLLDRDTTDFLTYATNPSNSPESRAEAANNALLNIDNAVTDLGPEKAEERRQKFYYSLARGSLTTAIDKGVDAETALNDFRDNKSEDPVVSAARQNLSQTDVDKIYGEVKTSTDRARTLAERKQKGQREEIALNFGTEMESMVNDLEVNANMADENVATKFNEQSTEMINNAVDAHEGNEESKAALSIQLRKLRSKQIIKIGDLQQTAQRKSALRKVSGDVRALVTDVTRDPGQLGNSIETLDLAINESASRFANTDDEETARQAGREDLIEAALNTYVGRGNINAARELYNSPGIAQALTPGLQEDFKQKFTDYENKNTEKRREYNTNVALFEAAAGRKPTPKERLRLAGPEFEESTSNRDVGASFRKEFSALSKRFVEIQDGYNKVKLASEAGADQRIAGDFSMIFNFMKMLDPGVVRESEFRTIAAAGGLPAQVQSSYNRLMGDKLLPDNIRKQYIVEAKKLYDAQVAKQRGLETQYTEIAKRLRFAPEEVITKFIGLGMNNPQQQDDQGVTSAPIAGNQPSPNAAQAPAAPSIRIDLTGKVIN